MFVFFLGRFNSSVVEARKKATREEIFKRSVQIENASASRLVASKFDRMCYERRNQRNENSKVSLENINSFLHNNLFDRVY